MNLATKERLWPPIDWLWQDYKQASAWYAGTPEELQKASTTIGDRFWKSGENIKLHIPIAADISALSAAMIFSESPSITCNHNRTSERISEIFDKSGAYSVLLQAAELASAFGGVFLKWSWDKDDGFPWLSAVPADSGLPEWRGGKIYKITIWNIVREDTETTGAIWRLEEEYTSDGHIISRLLKGDQNNLGAYYPLTAIPETSGIKEDANSGTNCMLAFYVPNILPNRKAPHLRFGRSDYDGIYGMFDALDEVYSSIQRETRLTKTTTIVPAEYLRKRDMLFGSENGYSRENQWVFCNDSGVFTALDIDSGRTASPVTTINPEIRAEQRIALCEDLVRRILSMAGYAPQSAGLDITGSAESGTALTVRERKTLRTTESKKTHWWHALHDIIRAMLKLDSVVFHSGVDANAEISIEMPKNTQPDIAQLAQTVEELERAGAASVETKVEILHPDWSDEQKAEEVARIKAERGLSGPDPIDPSLGDMESGPDKSEEDDTK